MTACTPLKNHLRHCAYKDDIKNDKDDSFTQMLSLAMNLKEQNNGFLFHKCPLTDAGMGTRLGQYIYLFNHCPSFNLILLVRRKIQKIASLGCEHGEPVCMHAMYSYLNYTYNLKPEINDTVLRLLLQNKDKQAGAELCQAQFKLGQLIKLQSVMLNYFLASYVSLFPSQLLPCFLARYTSLLSTSYIL